MDLLKSYVILFRRACISSGRSSIACSVHLGCESQIVLVHLWLRTTLINNLYLVLLIVSARYKIL